MSSSHSNNSSKNVNAIVVVVDIILRHSVLIGLLVRLFLGWFLPWLLDSGRIIPNVEYTDIDYTIFTDASEYVKLGKSPYDRHTYRYTPFLAQLLACFTSREIGRYIFCIADSICGWIILQFRTKQRRRQQQQQATTTNSKQRELLLIDAMLWNYNPLAINICTRGSAESLMVLLPVLLTLWISSSSSASSSNNINKTQSTTTIIQVLLAGICHGIAIHSKLYPIIYTLSYMSYFATFTTTTTTTTCTTTNENNNNNDNNQTLTYTKSFPWMEPKRLLNLVIIWIKRLLKPIPILFMITSLSTFAGLTYLAVRLYGDIALQEGLLYHFSRVDHRHNYSMYWYWIYLARAKVATTTSSLRFSPVFANNAINDVVGVAAAASNDNLKFMGRILLLPQFVLLVYSSLGIAPYNLGLALFIQTYLFVIHNKVITAQYFTWYLCLLPICSDSFSLTKRVKISLLLLLLSIGFWLGSAYCLEMKGYAAHRFVYIASVVYFFANVNMMGALLRSSSTTTATATATTTTEPTKEQSKMD